MYWNLEARIKDRAESKIRKYDSYARWVQAENARRARRFMLPQDKLRVRRPALWSEDKGYDPFHVMGNVESIAHSITKKLQNCEYRPFNPCGRLVPKGLNEERLVTSFQIADEAVSEALFLSLLRKNGALFSGAAFAYRPGLIPHDAVRNIRDGVSASHRTYVAEYDFRSFFDSIGHEYLLETFESLGIAHTPVERSAIEAFMRAPSPIRANGRVHPGTNARHRGIPQGTSISLFLANVAATPLDRALEGLGVQFARYADDTIVWHSDYGRVNEAANIIAEFSDRASVKLNQAKSPGINLLLPPGAASAEIRSKKSVLFLGYEISADKGKIRIPSKNVKKIKERINSIVYFNLIHNARRPGIDPARILRHDRDYLIAIMQIRRFLYGSLSEGDVRKYEGGSILPMSFEGVMSFYPLVTDEDQLRKLDGWLLKTLWRALRARKKMLEETGAFPPESPVPHNSSIDDLTRLKVTTISSRTDVDWRAPSFLRISRVIRMSAAQYGLNGTNWGSQSYNYS